MTTAVDWPDIGLFWRGWDIGLFWRGWDTGFLLLPLLVLDLKKKCCCTVVKVSTVGYQCIYIYIVTFSEFVGAHVLMWVSHNQGIN